MKKYYFDFVDDDHSTKDVDGHSCGNDNEALADALRAASHILTTSEMMNGRTLSCTIKDQECNLVYRVTLTLNVGEDKGRPTFKGDLQNPFTRGE